MLPLCVDLDGTLVKSDTLWEALFMLVRQRPVDALLTPFWTLGGKARFKERVARRVSLDPASLPYNEPLLEYLRAQKKLGRPLVLATAANSRIASSVAEHVGIFDEVIASDADRNVSGHTKLKLLEDRFGAGQFDYAGNGNIDLPIWRKARNAVIVNPDNGVEAKVRVSTPVTQTFETRRSRLGSCVRGIRAYQWIKNLLVFVPLLASHQLTAISISQAMLAFLAFSFSASSAYLVNDALDLPADRLHEEKRYRPLAAGDLSLPVAVLLAFVLLAAAAAISLGLPTEFRLLLAGYVLVTLLYSLALKRIVLVDVLTLAGLYTLRVIAGGAAVSIVPSFWLLAFSMFLFLSLALIKRSAELGSRHDASDRPLRRGYGRADLDHLRTMGVASGYLSVLVVALYINSEEVLENYSFPEALWLVCPLLLYWVSRLWLKTGRGEMHHDPLIFAIRDPISQCLAALMFLAVLLAV